MRQMTIVIDTDISGMNLPNLKAMMQKSRNRESAMAKLIGVWVTEVSAVDSPDFAAQHPRVQANLRQSLVTLQQELSNIAGAGDNKP